MAITHVVIIKMNPTLDEEKAQEVCQRMLSLKTECIHSATNQPYIVHSSGGKDNSPEGRQGGFTHAFVVEFASSADRDYYANEDRAHLDFVEWAMGKGYIAEARVLDYEAGVF